MKNRYLLSLSLLLLTIIGFLFFNKTNQNYSLSREEYLVNEILFEVAQKIKKTYKIEPCGSGAAMPEGVISKLTLCFGTNYPYNKNQLRDLLINSANELLSAVIKSNEIQKHLKSPPFTIQNIQIIIYNHEITG